MENSQRNGTSCQFPSIFSVNHFKGLAREGAAGVLLGHCIYVTGGWGAYGREKYWRIKKDGGWVY